MELDLDTARAIFDASTDYTVGLEEEFAVLDPATLEMAGRFEQLRDAAARSDPRLAEAISGELIDSEIEIRSGRGEDLAAARGAQQDLRRRLFALAADQGTELGATGTHPFSDYRRQHTIQTEHYRRVEEGLKYVAWRNNTFSLHVHVGIRGADRAVAVCDRLRPVLPVLLAISANSPFLDGRDSGLASARTQTFTKSFPRCGIPDPFGDWAAFADYIEFLVRTRSIVEYTQVWWSIRPHFSFGTVEVRICDAQATAGESDGLAALAVACVAQAARDLDEGVPAQDLAGRLIEENLWRALRYGLDGELLDLERRQPYPAGAGPRPPAGLDRADPLRARDRRRPAVAQRRPAPARPAPVGAEPHRGLRRHPGTDPRDVFPGPVRPAGLGGHRGRPREQGDEMSATGEPSEEELRAAYEAEIKKIRVEQIVLEQVVSLINLGMRRTGLAPGTEDERDIGQVRVAIESVRALLPVLGQAAPGQIGQIRDALSQLQMAFVRLGGAPAEGGEGDAAAARPGRGRGTARARGRRPAPRSARPRWSGGSPRGSGEAGRGGTGPAQRPPVDPRSISRAPGGLSRAARPTSVDRAR